MITQIKKWLKKLFNKADNNGHITDNDYGAISKEIISYNVEIKNVKINKIYKK